MGLLRKKTAAEKERAKDQKEAKKELRHEKRDERKEARDDKRETREDAREDKREVRNSDLTGKEKRDALKDIREQKKSELKDVREDKREDIRDIKDELKAVRRWLDIELPTVPGNVALLREDLSKIAYDNGTGARPMDVDDAFALLDQSYALAKTLADRGLEPLDAIVAKDRDKWVSSWAKDATLVEWFGDAEKPDDVKDVHDRLTSVQRRLNKQVTIRLHPQREYSVSAQNNGTFFEPKTFKVFPNFFSSAIDGSGAAQLDEMASVMIHELIHLWFTDQKLEGVKVYGATLARQLATDEPKKARRSAENYEHYCKSFA